MDPLFDLIAQIPVLWSRAADYLAFETARLREPEMAARLALQLLLFTGSAFFSGSETALFSLSRLDLQHLRRRGHPRSEVLHALLDQPRRLIISILCGNELVNIAASANMVAILYALYGAERAGWINMLLMVPLLLLFAEVTPKTLAVTHPVSLSTRVVALPMDIWVRLITPLRWLIRGVSDRLTTLVVGSEREAEHILHPDEFRSLVEEITEEGVLSATDRTLIYNLLDAASTEVVEIMTPRTQTHFLSMGMGVEEMVRRVRESRRHRLPVYLDQPDNVVGFVHTEDIMRLVLDGADLSALSPVDILHPPVVVPLTKSVDEMLEFFQSHDARAAVVLNEFGGVEGLVTIDDVLTFIFGEFSGSVRGAELYQERDENIYEVPGDMKLNDFNSLTNFGIEDPRMTTIGGVAFRHLDRLPREGDTIAVEGIAITVLRMDGHRIAQVRVAKDGGAGALAGEQGQPPTASKEAAEAETAGGEEQP